MGSLWGLSRLRVTFVGFGFRVRVYGLGLGFRVRGIYLRSAVVPVYKCPIGDIHQAANLRTRDLNPKP